MAEKRGTKTLQVHMPVLLKWYRHEWGKAKGRWLNTIAYLAKGTKLAESILQALDTGTPIAIRWELYKWELGWHLQES